MPASPARCPQCGFSYAWRNGRCGHCPSPGRAWELWFGAAAVRDFWPFPADRRPSRLALLNFAAACLARVADHLADPAARRFVVGWDAGPGGSRLAALAARSVAALPFSEQAGGHPTDPPALAAYAAGGLRHLLTATAPTDSPRWAAEAVAGRCQEAVGAAAIPVRAYPDLPLPPDLEPHRAAALDYIARAGRSRGTGPRGKAARRALDELSRTAAEDQARRQAAGRAEERAQCHLFRDAVRCPYGPADFDPGWRTEAVVGLAHGMYQSDDFAAVPILADALADAGCEDPAVLGHCRDPEQPHARGCWVVEAILAGN